MTLGHDPTPLRIFYRIGARCETNFTTGTGVFNAN